MHLTIVTPLYPPDLGRLSRYVRELAIRLNAEHTVTVVTYGTIPEETAGVLIRTVSKNLPILLRISAFTFRLWLESRRSDALYVCDGASVGWPAIVAAWFWRIPVVRLVMADEVWERAQPLRATSLAITNDTQVINNKLAMIQALQRWVLHNADHVFVPTKTLKTFFQERQQVPEEQLRVVPYPPDRAEILPFSSEPLTHQLLVTDALTSLEPFQTLLEVVDTLRHSVPNLRLVFANTGSMESTLQAQVDRLQLQTHVSFLGVVSRAQRWQLYHTSGALLALTEDLNALDTMREGLAAGVPLVTLKTPEYQTLIGSCGIPLSDLEVTTLTEALTRLLKDPSLQEELRVEGRARIEHLAGWGQHLEQLTACIPRAMLSPTL